MADTEEIFSLNFNVIIFLFSTFLLKDCFATIRVSKIPSTPLVHEFDALPLSAADKQQFSSDSYQNLHRLTKRDTTDETCRQQETNFLKDLATKNIDDEYTFENETNTAMALAWAGNNDGVLIIVTSEGIGDITTKSSVFRSTDYGLSYSNLSKEQNIINVIKKHNGLQRNPHDAKKVYLIGEGMHLYVTDDGGLKFTHVDLPFTMSDELIFHSSPKYSDYLMAQNSRKDLFISKDNGKSWSKMQGLPEGSGGVDKAVWGVLPEEGESTGDTPETIYFTHGATQVDDPILQHFFGFVTTTDYTLAKSTDGGKTYVNLLKGVVSFERQGKFLYSSQIMSNPDKNNWRHLMISTDGGKTFEEAQLPTIEPDRFYSLMEIDDDMIFMHVDNKEDTGHGTLYTSASQGVVYSESLPKHLFPNFGEVHDFYKVKSMKGVYITSQMSDDDSIHTVITYDRGGEWQKIPRPDGAPCKDESKGCFLQIHGMYSVTRGVNSISPASEESAIGVIIAHGHVADALQVTEPDVFVSRDGGYTWSLSLKGSHHYQIGDHGGLLVAVSKTDPHPKTVKFSLDEGRCWHEYNYTTKNLKFTGLLTEPEGNSTVFLLWGYVEETKKWEVHVIDFQKVIPNKCGANDYEVWEAHVTLRLDEGQEARGCLLGVRETFQRLKKDSWCYNGFWYEVNSTKETCKCFREDYECDYGYFRPGGSDDCLKETEFKGPEVDICLHGHQEKIVSKGYRKIPGDKCQGGFLPSSETIDLNKVCDEFGKSVVEIDETDPNASSKESSLARFGSGIKLLAIILVILVFALASIMGIYFVRKFILLRRHRTEYRYSLLNQSEQQNLMADDDDADEPGNLERDLDKALSSTVKYHDSDDEELNREVRPSTTRLSTARQNGVLKKPSPTKDTNPFGSYHDDSDDDMLS